MMILEVGAKMYRSRIFRRERVNRDVLIKSSPAVSGGNYGKVVGRIIM